MVEKKNVISSQDLKSPSDAKKRIEEKKERQRANTTPIATSFDHLSGASTLMKRTHPAKKN